MKTHTYFKIISIVLFIPIIWLAIVEIIGIVSLAADNELTQSEKALTIFLEIIKLSGVLFLGPAFPFLFWTVGELVYSKSITSNYKSVEIKESQYLEKAKIGESKPSKNSTSSTAFKKGDVVKARIVLSNNVFPGCSGLVLQIKNNSQIEVNFKYNVNETEKLLVDSSQIESINF